MAPAKKKRLTKKIPFRPPAMPHPSNCRQLPDMANNENAGSIAGNRRHWHGRRPHQAVGPQDGGCPHPPEPAFSLFDISGSCSDGAGLAEGLGRIFLVRCFFLAGGMKNSYVATCSAGCPSPVILTSCRSGVTASHARGAGALQPARALVYRRSGRFLRLFRIRS